jgi:hypothetical protein
MKNDTDKQTNIQTSDDEKNTGSSDHTNFDIGCKGSDKGEENIRPIGWAYLRKI